MNHVRLATALRGSAHS